MTYNPGYLDRIRNNQQRYGYSKPKINYQQYHNQYIPINKIHTQNTHKSDIYQSMRKRHSDLTNNCRQLIQQKLITYVPRPKSNVSITRQSIINIKDYQHQNYIDKQIHGNYDASRRKNFDHYNNNGYSKRYEKQSDKIYNVDYLMMNRGVFHKAYQRERNPQIKLIHSTLPINQKERESFHQNSLKAQQQISPIKQMMDLDDSKSYRDKQLGSRNSQTKQKQTSLTELTTNQLHLIKTPQKQKKSPDKHKQLLSTKQSSPYKKMNEKYSHNVHRSSHSNLQNKNSQFTISSINSIQKRIKQILSKK